MKKVLYYLADVFTDEVFGGNQLAVFPDGQEVPEHLMQRIAKELNLSETTFVLPPENPQNDIKLRIFTPGKELPMAGHPTIGTAYVLLQQKLLSAEGRNRLIFEEGVGDIPIVFEQNGQDLGLITMSQPLPEFGQTVTNAQVLADLLSVDVADIVTEQPAQVVSCGVPYLYVPLKSMAAVKKARLRTEVLENQLRYINTDSIFLFSLETEQAAHTVHGRMFAPAFGIPEDPATGSACGPLGCYLVHHGLVPTETDTTEVKIICEQGFEMGRPSLLYITIGHENDTITGVKVGGKSVLVGEGYFYL
ncbi:PhzF family phenazine biosynthesis protein [Adhaeribacter radiodurans]|uniref:PhzF family phenazine biosynthesis protein n=1 Tax=Adhaeribacter radiodurans TaxID=2745197 RepID=A0A7L7LDW5_9BACT|nr:PhzF family phenazine biosynthesis protein [Adhaeribacter radiodurans]QMU30973.1 PhzF family phenazine biosynthesis protein [Adhaeribacter radiodurans]